MKKYTISFILISIILTIFFFWYQNKNKLMHPDYNSDNSFNIIKYGNSDSICSGINNSDIRIYVHSYYGYDGNHDFLVAPRKSNRCNNEEDYGVNGELRNVREGNNYSPWVNYYETEKNSKLYSNDTLLKSSGEYTPYDYVGIRNNPQMFQDNGLIAQSNVLRPGEKIYFELDLTNSDNVINYNVYSDLRLSIDYGVTTADIDISLTNSIAYYVYTEDGHEYGPYKLYDSEYLKTYVEETTSSTTEITIYHLISENLLKNVPKNIVIDKIKVVPYEYYPVHKGSFKMFSVSLDGYEKDFKNKYYININNAENVIRNEIVSKMIDIATFKWSVVPGTKLTFYDYYSTGDPSVYENGKYYYGIPYTVTQQTTISSFINHSQKENDNNLFKLPLKFLQTIDSTLGNTFIKDTDIGENLYVYEKNANVDSKTTRKANLEANDYILNKDGYLIGLDSESSVNYATLNALPIKDYLSNSSDYFTSSYYEIVGEIEFNNAELEEKLRRDGTLSINDQVSSTILDSYYTSLIKSKYSSQTIYESYALSKPGDVLAKRGHSRLITDNTIVVCNNDNVTTDHYVNGFCNEHGGIDPEKSYIVVTEISLQHLDRASTKITTSQGKKVGESLHVHSDLIDSMLNNEYTDISSIDDIYNGIIKSNYNVNIKYMFSDLFNDNNSSGDSLDAEEGMYLPFRFKNMNNISSNKVEIPTINFSLDYDGNIAQNMYEFIKNNKKLKGTVSSNYLIEAIKVQIDNKKYYIYPTQTHVFSLYNSTNETVKTINKYLEEKFNNNANHIISISVKSGPQLSALLNYIEADSEGYYEVLKLVQEVQEVNKYIVSFDSDGGSSVVNQEILEGEKVIKPSNPIKEGYLFIEWQLNNQTYDFNNPVTSNLILTAKWQSQEEQAGILQKILQDYQYSIKDNYVSGFNVGDSITDIKNKLGKDIIINSNLSIISTGTIIQKGNEGYTVIIKGDLNGDGRVNSGDLLQMRKFLLEEINLMGAYKEAGIIESVNDVKSLDLLRLRQYLLGNYQVK